MDRKKKKKNVERLIIICENWLMSMAIKTFVVASTRYTSHVGVGFVCMAYSVRSVQLSYN